MFKLKKYYPKGFSPQHFWDDKYAKEHIAGKSSEEFKRQGFWPLMKNYLPKDKKCLDVGCGIGGWILFLKDEGYDVEGIDIAPRTVRALTEYDHELKVKVASMTTIPYPDNFFGGVLAVGTLEYVEDKVPEALAEVNRVLAPGGVFFLEVPIVNWLRWTFYIPLKKVEALVRGWQGVAPSFANYLFTRRELKEHLEKAGFEIVKEQAHELPESDSHYGLYVDWKMLRGSKPYKLNKLGLITKKLANAISPWVASTGVAIVVQKR
jgi:ubiquinone/menaquinone biosynthesis C-methylase UbiE